MHIDGNVKKRLSLMAARRAPLSNGFSVAMCKRVVARQLVRVHGAFINEEFAIQLGIVVSDDDDVGGSLTLPIARAPYRGLRCIFIFRS